MTLGDVTAFIQYSRQFTQPLTQLASMTNLLQSGVASAERVFELLDADEQKSARDRRDELLAELQAMNPAWESASQPGPPRAALPLERLEQIYRLLSYFSRWSEQLQERIVQLSF